MNNKQLYQISKYSYEEAFLQNQLNLAGSNLNNIMEKMEKNKNYLRTMNLISKIIMVVYISLLIFLPIVVFQNVSTAIEANVPFKWVNFLGQGIFSAFFFIQVIYMLMFGLFYITGLFSGESFQWLSTLPVKKESLGKICMWTFFRSVNAPLIALMVVFPIAIAIISQSFIITLISLVISLLDTLFGFSLLIILGKYFTNLIRSSDGKSNRNQIIQIIFYLFYMVFTFVAVLGFQYGMPVISEYFYDAPNNLELYSTISDYLALLPFPFAGSSILTKAIIGFDQFSTLSIIYSIIGLGIFALIDMRLLKRAQNKLFLIVYPKDGQKQVQEVKSTIEDVQVSPTSALKSFLKKDLQLVLREYQALMMLIMPFVLMLVSVVISKTMGDGTSEDSFSSFITIFVLYGIMGGFMQMFGVLNLESTGATITSSLPINPRDQAKAKIVIFGIALSIASLIPAFFYIGQPPIADWWKVYLILFPIPALYGVMLFLLKIRLFGKMKYKYVMEEIKLNRKALKIGVMGFVSFIIGMVIAILVMIAFEDGLIDKVLIFALPGEMGLGLLIYGIFNKMFPKSVLST
jgi:predicted permease